MKTKKNESKVSLKSYHIFLLSCLLCSIFILNSNYVNEKRTSIKKEKQEASFFNQLVNKRMLESLSEGDENSGTQEIKNSKSVCSRGSDDLNSYYETGDKSKINLDDEGIECKNKNDDYMQAMIALVKKYVENNDTDSNEGEDEEFDKENAVKYIKHIFPLLIFFVIGILSIIGWLICCFCNCCNCCCCCCCKKPGCKVPCFIFTYIFYALAIIACVYGLSKSNKIFVGLANTECSVLKLLEQVVDGEAKTTTPRWIGISGINGLLSNLTKQINSTKQNALNNLLKKKSEITSKKETFTSEMESFDGFCYNNGDYPSNYTRTFKNISLQDYNSKKYVLDIIKLVGHYNDTTKEYTDKSFLYFLNLEYSEIAERTDGYISTSETSFRDILNESSAEVMEALDKAQDTLDKLKKPFDKINDKIGDRVVDYSESIDKYGKLTVKLVFTILMIINIALAVLLLLICLCSGKYCTGCCCCRCLCKCFTHLFWNILALMMILSFIVGSIIALVGRVGDDAMSLVSHILSEENFENDEPLLLGKMGDAKKYLSICLHGNGSLESEFDLGDSLNAIEDIDDVLNGIDNITQQFRKIKNNLPTFKTFFEQIKNRTDYLTSNFGLVEVTNPESIIALRAFLNLLNTEKKPDGIKETWDIDGDETKVCKSGTDGFDPGDYKFHPSTCKPRDRDWIQTSNSKIKDYAEIISTIVDLVSKLKEENEGTFKNKLNKLNQTYDEYMGSYLNMSTFLKDTIGGLIGQIRDTVGDGNFFSFLNGKFIGTNIQIILKYLKYSLGQDFYNVGICLIIVGCSLILSISSTILLIVIINVVLEHNIEKEKKNDNTFAREKNFGNSEDRKFAKI